MKNIQISTTNDHLSRVASGTNAIKAVSELIWNSLDAGANNITAVFDTNHLGGLDLIEVRDDGCGINATQVERLFGNLGDSWKRTTEKFKNRPLHGKKGEGRFKAFSLGESLIWETVYEDDNDHKHYRFTIHGSMSGETIFSYDEPQECSDRVGTTVRVQAISKNQSALLAAEAVNHFTVIFAGYLHKFPNVNIYIDGTRLTPENHCKIVHAESLSDITATDGKQYPALLEIVEWDISVPRELQLCDDSGIELQVAEAKVNAKGEKFSIRIRSDYFKILDQQNLLLIDTPEIQDAIDAGRNIARGYFRRKRAAEAANVVQQWKDEKIYPFEDKEEKELSAIEIAERQVFDIIGVNVQDFLPDFDKADSSAKKFTFRLLAQALKDNPESLQKILTEVLNLDPEKQADLADLLQKTDLANIIKCAKTVANRLDFLVGLENLLFDKETKYKLLERDQLHKILENEAWIFDENFTLSASEATLNEVLQKHRKEYGLDTSDDSPVLREDGREGRVDLFLGLATCPREGEKDHLVIELKRPKKKIDGNVLMQVDSYALAISNDPRFEKSKTHWKIIAISDEMDPIADMRAHQANKPVGLVTENAENNIEVWAFTWTQVISRARAKLHFLNESLRYEADRESAKKYLLEKHEKFIPQIEKENPQADNKTEESEEPEEVTNA